MQKTIFPRTQNSKYFAQMEGRLYGEGPINNPI